MLQLLWGLVGLGAGWLLGARRSAQAETAARKNSELTHQQLAEHVARAQALVHQIPPLVDELDALRATTESFAPLTEELRVAHATANGLRENAAALDKQLGRIGREQFKINTLAEAQQLQVQHALEQLRDLSARRESDVALLREQLRAEQSAQRLTVIQQLLPALDGLDEAIAAGQRLLARATRTESAPQPLYTLSFQQRVAIAMGRGELPTVPANGAEEWRQAAAAWLAGIELVRARLLRVLAAENVQPIHAQDEPFDPHLHIAVEIVPSTEHVAAGTVVEEYRRGYRVGERVLRPAEVVVAK
ncbi:MAG: nucleotide exchange factor GrpE [Chloroflexi bacterium]|nr:nucleotide exchange factor GrpE [Chloroflexota bacterium]